MVIVIRGSELGSISVVLSDHVTSVIGGRASNVHEIFSVPIPTGTSTRSIETANTSGASERRCVCVCVCVCEGGGGGGGGVI